MKDYSGTVESISTETSSAKITLSMFGRDTSVEVPLNQIEVALD